MAVTHVTVARGAISVSSDLSATSLRVTDTLVLRISARWEGEEALYRFATPRPVENPSLQLTGQTVGGSQRLENGVFISQKTWHFAFICVQSGTTEVVPPVIAYTNNETGAADSAIISPISLTIAPAPPPPFDYTRLWPYVLGLVVVSIGAYAGMMIVRRRRRAALHRKLHKTPEEQAAELLEALKPLKREDKSEQFYGDLEKVIQGLWEARAGRRLAGKTPTEVAQVLLEAGVSEAEYATVREVLVQCHHARFGGGSGGYDAMDKSYQIVSAWLKPPTGS